MTELAIYVSDDCWSCAESRRIAAEVADEFPEVDVLLIDMESGPLPAAVFAAPTYLLDGRVLFLGNPRREELWQQLRERQHKREAKKR